jgi:excisionase family DNA binding protein
MTALRFLPFPVLDRSGTTTGTPVLTPAEVARLFGVDPKTVIRSAASGRLGFIRTPGGHHRSRRSEIDALLTDRGHDAR